MRVGDWKLIRFYCLNDDHTDRLELYNLREDLGESHNLAAQYPERVAALGTLIQGFLKETEAVVPACNPRYDPQAKTAPAGPKAKAKRTGKPSASTRDLRLQLEAESEDDVLGWS